MNNLTTFGQTFSKGQLTIPKKIRDYYGLGENFAYKISPHDDKIIIEPQEKRPKKITLSQVLAKIKEPIFSDQDYQDYLTMRQENEDRMQKLGI
jgi:AbrB family looped-hinge helix DNA binding protein